MSETDPEKEHEVVLIVKLPTFGRQAQVEKTAYTVTKLLTDRLNTAEAGKEPMVKVHHARLEYQGNGGPVLWEQLQRVLYDSFKDDGHHSRKPWWEVKDEEGAVDASEREAVVRTASPNGSGAEGPEAHDD